MFKNKYVQTNFFYQRIRYNMYALLNEQHGNLPNCKSDSTLFSIMMDR